MVLVKKTGYTLKKLHEVLGNMVQKGQGDLVVMIEVLKDGKSLITPAGKGIIGMSSDGRKVLVIMAGGDNFDLPIISQPGAQNVAG